MKLILESQRAHFSFWLTAELEQLVGSSRHINSQVNDDDANASMEV